MHRSFGQFFRFLLIGVVNTLFGYGLFSLLLYLNIHYAIASFWATLLGVLFNFHTTGRFVFGSRDRMLIFKFVAVYAIVYLLGVGGLKALASFGINYYLGGALLLLPSAAVSFLLSGFFNRGM